MSRPETTDSSLQPLVAAEYMALADLLGSLAEAGWDTSSLCEGWRVREVVAHMTMPARYDEEAFMSELRARSFDFDRLSNDIAARDAQRPVDELLRDLRAEELHHWTPPGGGYRGALNHVVIHSLDITIPLGAGRLTGDDTMRWILDDLTEGGTCQHFGTDIAGRRFEASDLAWSYGSGPALRVQAGELALVLCGRTIPPERALPDAAPRPGGRPDRS